MRMSEIHKHFPSQSLGSCKQIICIQKRLEYDKERWYTCVSLAFQKEMFERLIYRFWAWQEKGIFKTVYVGKSKINIVDGFRYCCLRNEIWLYYSGNLHFYMAQGNKSIVNQHRSSLSSAYYFIEADMLPYSQRPPGKKIKKIIVIKKLQ